MAQKVMTHVKQISAIGPDRGQPFAVDGSSILGKALADDWNIVHLSTCVIGEFHYTTVVIEKHESNMESGN